MSSPSKESRFRRTLAGVAALSLAILLLARNPPQEIAQRVRYLEAYAARELVVRRLGGSSTAFDRRFFQFLQSARRRLSAKTPGVALFLPVPSERALYLAAYQFAPIPVALAPPRLPRGWIVAIYGPGRPEGWKTVAEVPGGALLEPSSPPR